MQTSTYRYLDLDRNDGIATVALANPEKRNALSLAAMEEMLEVLPRSRPTRA
jgi:enoyl-CoA hydratase/carnithine racemase